MISPASNEIIDHVSVTNMHLLIKIEVSKETFQLTYLNSLNYFVANKIRTTKGVVAAP